MAGNHGYRFWDGSKQPVRPGKSLYNGTNGRRGVRQVRACWPVVPQTIRWAVWRMVFSRHLFRENTSCQQSLGKRCNPPVRYDMKFFGSLAGKNGAAQAISFSLTEERCRLFPRRGGAHPRFHRSHSFPASRFRAVSINPRPAHERAEVEFFFNL